jgi:hypothetical protein
MINDHGGVYGVGGGIGAKFEQSIEEYASQNLLLGTSKHFSCNI